MELGHGYSKVVIDTTSSTAAEELLAAATGKIPYLHRLYVKMVGAGNLKIQSVTTGSTMRIIAPQASTAAGNVVDLGFEPRIDGCPQGARGGNLQLLSTGTTYKGFAIVSRGTTGAGTT